MTRRITVGLVAALALALTACEVNVDYDLLLNADASSELQVDIVYDEEASQMLGPPEAFVDEVEMDAGGDISGVRVISSSADGSDPDAQRVSMTFAADDETALDALLRDSFDGSFTVQDGDVYELYLRAEDASMDGEMDLGMDFMSGSMVVRHDGQRESLSGGEEVDDQTVNWDPFGPQDLRLVVDLSAGGSAGGFALGAGVLLLIGLGLLALLVIGLVIFLVVRRGKGGERAPAAGPMTGPMAGEIDAMQTPPAAGAAWGGHPQQAPPGNWDQQAQPSTPGGWDQPSQPTPPQSAPPQSAPEEPSGDQEQPGQPPQPAQQPPPGSWDPPQAPRGPEDDPDREPPPPGP